MSANKKIQGLEDLQPNPRNHNKGTERGVYAIEQSIRRLGAGRSGVSDAKGRMIAGNHTLEAIAHLGIPVKVIPTDGTEWVVLQRTDLDLERDDKAVELSYADNRTTQLNLDVELEQFAADVEQIDFSYLYTETEIRDILSKLEVPDDNEQIDEEKLDEKKHSCPSCGYEW